jgi:hypothetical protein
MPPNATSFEVRRESFRADGEQRLALACAPFLPRQAGLPDDRELGVAMFRADFEPLG